MKFLATLMIAVCAAFAARGNDNQSEQWANIVRNSPDYICGEGFGESYEAADRAAMADLISKISVSVSSTFEVEESEFMNSEGHDASTALRSLMNSYAQATLTNSENVLLKNTPGDTHVLRYVKRDEVNRMFDERRERVFDYVRAAQRALNRLRIDDALRNYYWAYSLLRSLQYPNSVKMNDEGEERMLISWIPEQINDILDQLNVSVAGQEGNDVDLLIKYGEVPVTSVEFTYFDGRGWSARHAAKDGMGAIELRPGADTGSLQLRYEYEYRDQASMDRELEPVMEALKGTAFAKAYTTLPAGKKNSLAVTKADRKAFQNQVRAESTANVASVSADTAKMYAKKVDKVVQAVVAKNFTAAEDCFSPEGLDMFKRLIAYGNARVLGNPAYTFCRMGERTVCRSVPMSFNFGNNNRSFVEDVVFTFNSDGLIETVSFGLGREADNMVFGKGGTWTDYAKMILVSFLENYKTAFALKRLDYINSIFDDNAVIIVGNRVTPKKGSVDDGVFNLGNKELYKYTRLSKDQYLSNLERCFASNRFINIRFEDADVTKMGVGGEAFGIQVKQDYYSENYADTGYLFLIVDFNNPDEPLIKVRTWQPEKNPDVNPNLPRSSRDWGIFGPGSF